MEIKTSLKILNQILHNFIFDKIHSIMDPKTLSIYFKKIKSRKVSHLNVTERPSKGTGAVWANLPYKM